MTIVRVVNTLYPTQQAQISAVQPGHTRLLSKYVELTAATNNQIVLVSIADYYIKVFEINMHSVGVAGQVKLHDDAGTPQTFGSYLVPANTAASPNVYLQGYPYGLIETAQSRRIEADNLGAANIWITIRYLQWNPRDPIS